MRSTSAAAMIGPACATTRPNGIVFHRCRPNAAAGAGSASAPSSIIARAPPIAFFGRLEDEQDLAGQVGRVPRQQGRRAQAHRHVPVVAARVHHARRLRDVRARR